MIVGKVAFNHLYPFISRQVIKATRSLMDNTGDRHVPCKCPSYDRATDTTCRTCHNDFLHASEHILVKLITVEQW